MQKICDVFATIMEKLSILSILRRYQSYVFNILKWNHIVIRQFIPSFLFMVSSKKPVISYFCYNFSMKHFRAHVYVISFSYLFIKYIGKVLRGKLGHPVYLGSGKYLHKQFNYSLS